MALEDHREHELVKDRLLLTAGVGALVGTSLASLVTYLVLTAPPGTAVTTGPAVPDVPAELWVPVAAFAGLAWAAYGYVQVRGEWRELGVLDS